MVSGRAGNWSRRRNPVRAAIRQRDSRVADVESGRGPRVCAPPRRGSARAGWPMGRSGSGNDQCPERPDSFRSGGRAPGIPREDRSRERGRRELVVSELGREAPDTMSNGPLTAFVIVTAIAVVLQMAILLGMFLAVRKTSAKMESLAEEVKTKVLPSAELAHSMMSEMRPKIETLVDNVSVSTTMMRTQLERIDATLTDIVDRTRLQVIRADEFVTNTMDKLEETREAVQRTVVSPVRHLSGLMHGVTVGLETLFSRQKDRATPNLPRDEMFI